MKIFILALFLLPLLHESTGAPRVGYHAKRTDDEPPLTVDSLHQAYESIFFPSQNRNAASHLWVKYVLERSKKLTKDDLLHVFGGFCPVSGSPVTPSERNLFTGLKVKRVSSDVFDSVNVHVCCFPCMCDIQEFTKTDELTVKVKSDVDGEIVDHIFQVLVIGDPCSKPEDIPRDAPAVKCEDGQLKDAVLSDNGHVVIGMTQPENEDTKDGYPAAGLKNRCDVRRENGYEGGMGTIFLRIASISPIE